jgi:hypothetical protein
MPAAREDYLLRMIAQAAAAMRRLRERLRGGGSAEEVVRDAGAAIGELLGPQRSMLELLDPRSATSLLGNDERVVHWIAFVRLQADAERQAGRESQAAQLERRAESLEQALSRALQEVKQ